MPTSPEVSCRAIPPAPERARMTSDSIHLMVVSMARVCASSRSFACCSVAVDHASESDLGAENVRSNPATAFCPRPSSVDKNLATSCGEPLRPLRSRNRIPA